MMGGPLVGQLAAADLAWLQLGQQPNSQKVLREGWHVILVQAFKKRPTWECGTAFDRLIGPLSTSFNLRWADYFKKFSEASSKVFWWAGDHDINIPDPFPENVKNFLKMGIEDSHTSKVFYMTPIWNLDERFGAGNKSSDGSKVLGSEYLQDSKIFGPWSKSFTIAKVLIQEIMRDFIIKTCTTSNTSSHQLDINILMQDTTS